MLKYIKIAFRNLLTNKRRTLFIVSAITIGTIIMILTLSLSYGVRDNMLENSLALSTGHINIYGQQNVRGKNINYIDNFVDVDSIIDEANGDKIVSSVYRINYSGEVYVPNKKIKPIRSELIGIDIENETLYKDTVSIIEGDLNSIKNKELAIIDQNTANRYKLGVGDYFQFKGLVNSQDWGVSYNTIDLFVGAIVQMNTIKNGTAVIRVSIDTARSFSLNSDLEYSTIHLYIENKEEAKTIAENINNALTENNFETSYRNSSEKQSSTPRAGGGFGGRGPGGGFFGQNSDQITNKIQITTWKDETVFLEQMIQTLDRISTFLNIVLLSIILIGISNTLVMSIRERINEIGTIRAIGMQKASVMFMFVLEGLFLGLIGSFAGISIGGTISLILSNFGIYIGQSNLSMFLIDNTLFLKLNIESILIVIGLIVLISALASIRPSIRASNLSPTIAMEKE